METMAGDMNVDGSVRLKSTGVDRHTLLWSVFYCWTAEVCRARSSEVVAKLEYLATVCVKILR